MTVKKLNLTINELHIDNKQLEEKNAFDISNHRMMELELSKKISDLQSISETLTESYNNVTAEYEIIYGQKCALEEEFEKAHESIDFLQKNISSLEKDLYSANATESSSEIKIRDILDETKEKVCCSF